MFNGQPYKYNILNATFSLFALYFSFGLLEGDQGDFRTCADAGRKEGFAQPYIDVEMLHSLGV